MKAIEFESTLSSDSNLKVPAALAEQIPKEGSVRVIVLVPDDETDDAWRRLTERQFLSGYDEGDNIYDAV